MFLLRTSRTTGRKTPCVAFAIVFVAASLQAEGQTDAPAPPNLLMNSYEIHEGHMLLQLRDKWKQMNFSNEWSQHLIPSPHQGLFVLKPTIGILHPH